MSSLPRINFCPTQNFQMVGPYTTSSSPPLPVLCLNLRVRSETAQRMKNRRGGRKKNTRANRPYTYISSRSISPPPAWLLVYLYTPEIDPCSKRRNASMADGAAGWLCSPSPPSASKHSCDGHTAHFSLPKPRRVRFHRTPIQPTNKTNLTIFHIPFWGPPENLILHQSLYGSRVFAISGGWGRGKNRQTICNATEADPLQKLPGHRFLPLSLRHVMIIFYIMVWILRKTDEATYHSIATNMPMPCMKKNMRVGSLGARVRAIGYAMPWVTLFGFRMYNCICDYT